MAIQSMSASCNGIHMCSVSIDKTMKIFDVINFGKYMRNLYTKFTLEFTLRL